MRLIDADVFKENMDYICNAGGWLEPVTKAVREFVKRHIDAQTTVKPQPHWIPCSERLPEEDNVEVLCTVKQQSKTDRSKTIIVEQGCYFYGTWLLSYDNQRVNCSREVLAWQPLPSPYKEEGEEE